MVESSSGQESIASHGAASEQLVRPARVLVGWLPEEAALRLLNGSRADVEATEEQRARALAARTSVSNRPGEVDQTDAIREPQVGELDEHIRRLWALPASAPYAREGYRVAIVDLRKLCAFQPTVFTDSATDRVSGLNPGSSPAEIAEVSLPTQWSLEQQAQFDETRQTWLMVSKNPNLKVLGHFAAGVGDPPLQGFGFAVSVTPSFMQVGSYQGRYFLRDGYHRAFGLIQAGITSVPAFVREFDAIHDLVPQGMLPQEAFLGPQPPLLGDYEDDEVSSDVLLPAFQKLVLVQAIELTPRG